MGVEKHLETSVNDLIAEVEHNLNISTKPWSGKLLPFQTNVWDTNQDIYTITANIRLDLTQTYADISLANSIVRLSIELGHRRQDLDDKYRELCTSIAERLNRIKPILEYNTLSGQSTESSSPLEEITVHKVHSKLSTIEPIIYLLAIVIAQVVAALYTSLWGILSHTVILTVIIVRSALTYNTVYQHLLLSLALVPLLRIISLLGLIPPLGGISPMLLYFLSYGPIFVAAVAIVCIFGYTPTQVGISLGQPRTQLLVGLTGIVIGLIAYFILIPEPMILALTWKEALPPALILLVTAGFMQESVFRGLLQSSSTRTFGGWGIVYVSLLFAITHIGFLPLIGLAFVFVVALFYGWVVRKTGSILGVALSYGICNILLYLIIPFFF